MNRLLTATITTLTTAAALASAAQAEVLTIEGMTPANSPNLPRFNRSP